MQSQSFVARWSLFLVLLVGVLVFINLLSARFDRRIDLTEAKLHTISPETQRLLADIEDQVTITYYASDADSMPSGFQNFRRDTVDFLREYERAADGPVQIKVINPQDIIDEYVEAKREEERAKREAERQEAEEKKKEGAADENADGSDSASEDSDSGAESESVAEDSTLLADEDARNAIRWAEEIKQELAGRNIPELRGRSVERDQFSLTNFYSSIEIQYLDRPVEMIRLHQSLEGLEFELTSRIAKLTVQSKPKIAVFLGKPDDIMQLPPNPNLPPGQPPETMSVYQPFIRDVLMEQFDVVVIELTESSPIPEDAQVLIVAQPDQLTQRQLYEIDRSVVRGRPTLILASHTSGGLDDPALPISPLIPGLDPLFEKWGLSFGRDMISSLQCGFIEIVRNVGITMRQRVPLPLCPQVQGRGLNQESPLTQGLSALVFPFSSEIRPNPLVLENNGMVLTPLATTAVNSWLSPFRPQLQRGMVDPPGTPSARSEFIVGALLEGEFPSAFTAGDPLPSWDADAGTSVEGEDGETPTVEVIPEANRSPGRVILLGSADIGKYASLFLYRDATSNLPFLLGCVEALALGQDLLKIRAKKQIPRPLVVTTASQRWWTSYGNILVIPLCILFLALFRNSLRRAASRRYEIRYEREEASRHAQ